MKIAITKLVTGEKAGKPWYMVHAIQLSTGKVLSKFTSSEIFGDLQANPLPIEGMRETDVEFDQDGRIVGTR